MYLSAKKEKSLWYVETYVNGIFVDEQFSCSDRLETCHVQKKETSKNERYSYPLSEKLLILLRPRTQHGHGNKTFKLVY